MSRDIDEALSGWAYKPDVVQARVVEAGDGRDVIQMRLDLGVLQLELAGRPDGRKPSGHRTYYDYLKGQAVAAFVTLKESTKPSPQLVDDLKEHVVKKIGAIARPDQILFAADLPKTRSGKIMRRLLRDIAEGKALGDTTTLADPAVVARLKSEYEEKEG